MFNIISFIVFIPAGIVVGSVQGIYKCTLSYFKGLSYSFNKEYSIKAKRKLHEPAKEKYFFYKQYEDLLNTYSSAKSINKGNVLLLRKQLEEDDYFVLIKVRTTQFVIDVIGTILNAVFFFIHFLIVTIMSIPNFLLYSIVMSIEKVRFMKGKIWGVCPHCHSQFDIPYYICPGCGEIHKKLIPGPYGISKRKCRCGTVIPSTNFTGRFKLKAVCPVCSQNIESRETSPICIPIVGGKAVGKTSYMYEAADMLINDISKEKKWNIRFLNEGEEEKFNKGMASLKKGIFPEKTDKANTDAHNIFIGSKKFFSEKLLYMYDISGEYFCSRVGIRRQNYYKYINGLIFIIDPLSIVNEEKSIKIENKFINCNPSDTNTDDLIDRFIIGLREIKQIQLNKFIDIPVAVIINKMDAVDYKGEVMDFLKDAGEEKLIRKFEHNFANYKFFLCSVLGNTDSKEPCDKKGMEESIKWILSQANEELQ
ncbi:hypothetical protein JMF89_15755 [Clostridiaceae bacterium UIB06]|nr:hypothetical protein [Clostridiaceae bacterium UIB06]